jgi:hypothetical protein
MAWDGNPVDVNERTARKGERQKSKFLAQIQNLSARGF